MMQAAMHAGAGCAPDSPMYNLTMTQGVASMLGYAQSVLGAKRTVG